MPPDVIVPGSNFRGDRTQPVGEPATLSGFGTTDMAGNVKEWCLNEGENGKRLILGGGFGEPIYMFGQLDAVCPGTGSRTTVFAVPAGTPHRRQPPRASNARLATTGKSLWRRTKRTAPTAACMRTTERRSRLASRSSGQRRDWIREKVTFAAAYGGERVLAYLYLPKKAERPLQAVIYSRRRLDGHRQARPDAGAGLGYLPRSGRALVYPIYKGTYERQSRRRAAGSRTPRDHYRDRSPR